MPLRFTDEGTEVGWGGNVVLGTVEFAVARQKGKEINEHQYIDSVLQAKDLFL